MTVSMSALSKLRTMNRPRWAGGTGGAVGGATGGGAAARGGSAGAGSGRGPIEGVVGAGAGAAGGGATTGGGIGGAGGAPVGGAFAGVAHPPVRARRTTAVMLRFTLLLRGIRGRPLRGAAQEIRGERAAAQNEGRPRGVYH